MSFRYPDISGFEVLDILRIIRSENIGSKTFFDLINRYKNPQNVLEAIPRLAEKGGKRKIRLCSKEKAEQELEAVDKYGAKIILYGSEEYPELLHNIYDPPPLITLKGHPQIYQNKTSIGMVGARNASNNGCRFAHKIADELSEKGYLITSGLARGIDTFAHKGAVKYGTVGVIAGGIDNIYPLENKKLYQEIKETGAIISEQPFGAKPYSQAFPARNRIISGMSVGIVVVEASLRSGSLITARCAVSEHKEVMAVPGFPLDPRCQGTNRLIKDGAVLIESVKDIINTVEEISPSFKSESTMQYDIEECIEEYSEPSEQEVKAIQEMLLTNLTSTPTFIDELINRFSIPSSDMMIILLELELAGKIERHHGNKVSKVYK